MYDQFYLNYYFFSCIVQLCRLFSVRFSALNLIIYSAPKSKLSSLGCDGNAGLWWSRMEALSFIQSFSFFFVFCGFFLLLYTANADEKIFSSTARAVWGRTVVVSLMIFSFWFKLLPKSEKWKSKEEEVCLHTHTSWHVFCLPSLYLLLHSFNRGLDTHSLAHHSLQIQALLLCRFGADF